jgi:nucleoside-diphosphate-sugar epimerase
MNNKIMEIKNILITGISGFVGSSLAPFLEESGFKINGISRNPKSNNERSFNDLSIDCWNNAKAMIHLAGKSHDLRNTSDDSEYFEVNTELTKRLYNQFLESDCESFIYMSSVKAVADVVEQVLMEDEVPNAITAYGKSKLAAEQYILAQELPKGKYIYILRPCMIHGPGNKGNLNLLYAMANKGIPYPFGAFANERSFLSIDNLLFIMRELIAKKPTSGIYNMSDDAYMSTTGVYSIMGEVLGKKLSILNFSKKIIYIFGQIGDYIPLLINSEKIQKLTENYRVSNAKIKKELGITNLPISAKEGIYKTVASFKSQQHAK